MHLQCVTNTVMVTMYLKEWNMGSKTAFFVGTLRLRVFLTLKLGIVDWSASCFDCFNPVRAEWAPRFIGFDIQRKKLLLSWRISKRGGSIVIRIVLLLLWQWNKDDIHRTCRTHERTVHLYTVLVRKPQAARPLLVCDVKQLVLLVADQRFGTAYSFHLQRSRNFGKKVQTFDA